jgi:hypothetical protein
LAVGGVVYYITSPDVILVQKMDVMLGIARNAGEEIYNDNLIYMFLRNYFLDMLWAYSLTFCIHLLIDNNAERICKTVAITFTFSLVMEILQLTDAVKGTFDMIDILVEFIAIMTAVLIIKIQFRRNEDYEK